MISTYSLKFLETESKRFYIYSYLVNTPSNEAVIFSLIVNPSEHPIDIDEVGIPEVSSIPNGVSRILGVMVACIGKIEFVNKGIQLTKFSPLLDPHNENQLSLYVTQRNMFQPIQLTELGNSLPGRYIKWETDGSYYNPFQSNKMIRSENIVNTLREKVYDSFPLTPEKMTAFVEGYFSNSLTRILHPIGHRPLILAISRRDNSHSGSSTSMFWSLKETDSTTNDVDYLNHGAFQKYATSLFKNPIFWNEPITLNGGQVASTSSTASTTDEASTSSRKRKADEKSVAEDQPSTSKPKLCYYEDSD